MKTEAIEVVHASGESVPAFEQHFLPGQLAALWKLSADVVRARFKDEPGVLRITQGYRRGHDGRTTLRIPASVAARVHARLCGRS